MSRPIAFLVAAVAWFSVGLAEAQEFCADLRRALVSAQTEFADISGAPMSNTPHPDMSLFESALQISDIGPCVIAAQNSNGRRFSTSYTCANAAQDRDDALRSLQARVQQCLSVTAWNVQPNGAMSAQYGLIRLSMTRNGARGGIALGVEVFRDENGAIMGSPLRGDAINAAGVHRCTSKSAEEIEQLIQMYGARPGAERFESDDFIGYTNRQTQPVVAFVTRPVHPAHPAIIVRSVWERDGSQYISAGGDFAGDCEAFHNLIGQVQQMNQNLRQR